MNHIKNQWNQLSVQTYTFSVMSILSSMCQSIYEHNSVQVCACLFLVFGFCFVHTSIIHIYQVILCCLYMLLQVDLLAVILELIEIISGFPNAKPIGYSVSEISHHQHITYQPKNAINCTYNSTQTFDQLKIRPSAANV